MCIYIHIHIYTYIYEYTHVHIYTYMYINTWNPAGHFVMYTVIKVHAFEWHRNGACLMEDWQGPERPTPEAGTFSTYTHICICRERDIHIYKEL